MEPLLNIFGPSAAMGLVVLVALPLSALGWALRRRGRRGLERLARLQSARSRLGDVRSGAVTLVGKWRAMAEGRGLLQDADGRAVLVEFEGAAPAEADGFMVAGTAVGEIDDPRALDYRSTARLWRVEARAPYGVVGDEATILGSERRAAQRGAGLGAALFAAGVAVAMASVVVAIRAALGDG